MQSEPRSIKPEDIQAYVKSEMFFTAGEAAEALGRTCGEEAKLLTLCVIVLKNGFTVTGESACADPAKFNAEIGRTIAKANALNKVWPLMGYVLRSQIAGVSGLLEPEDYKDRARNELQELTAKIDKLRAFLEDDQVSILMEEREDLINQLDSMIVYESMLSQRAKKF